MARGAPVRDPDTCILSKLLASSDDAQASGLTERKWQWARPQVEGDLPCARGGHTATLVGPLDPAQSSARIVLFGGHYADEGGGNFTYMNDTHVLDIDENKWYSPRSRGTAPEGRYGHSAALVGTRIVYFGGKGKEKHFRDLHALDTSTLTWYQGPSSGGAPSARQGHTATLHGTRLYVLGGSCGAKYFGDLHCLDLSSMAWSAPQTTGPKPSARSGHVTMLVGESLLVHGGFCMPSADLATKDNMGELMKNCYQNDIRVLDLGHMQWSRLRTHGVPPSGRFGHSMVLSEDDAIMFGGWCGAAKNPGVSYSLKDKVGQEPSEGQGGEEESCDYCVTLRTSDMHWVRNKYVGVAPVSRYGHSTTAIGPHLIIVGGWDGGKPMNDVVVLRDRSVAERGHEEELLYDDGTVNAGVGDEGWDGDEDFNLETGEN